MSALVSALEIARARLQVTQAARDTISETGVDNLIIVLDLLISEAASVDALVDAAVALADATDEGNDFDTDDLLRGVNKIRAALGRKLIS